MGKTLIHIVFLVLSLTTGTAAIAQELVLGGGAAHFESGSLEETGIAQAEYHFPHFAVSGETSFSWAVAVEARGGGDYWLGVGAAVERPFGGGWFAEASVMPGIATPDLGTVDPAADIRFLVGLGRDIGARASLSLALSHRAGLGGGAAGLDANALSLRLNWRLD